MQSAKATPALASSITVGSVIMPPARELRLWMRRDLAERNLPGSALHMTVTSVREGASDKRGPWIVITAYLPDSWYSNEPYPWTLKMRPETMWPVISAAVNS